MKRFLTNTSVFIAFSVAAYIVFLTVCGKFAPTYLKQNLNYKKGAKGFMYSRLQEVKKTHDVDMLFLGSSHAYHGYDPRKFAELNLTSFNLGSSAQTPVQTEILMDQYLDQLNPKSVILDIYPIVFSSDGVESSIDFISNAPLDDKIVKMALETTNAKVLNTLAYGVITDLLQKGKTYKEPLVKGKTTYIPGGYVQIFTKYKPKKPIENRYIHVEDKQIAAFNRIIEKLKARNINYVLVQAPITKKNYESFQNNDSIDSLFATKGTYYNFNKILSLPDSLFFDDSHLNQYGVNVFNKKLIEVLKIKPELHAGKI